MSVLLHDYISIFTYDEYQLCKCIALQIVTKTFANRKTKINPSGKDIDIKNYVSCFEEMIRNRLKSKILSRISKGRLRHIYSCSRSNNRLCRGSIMLKRFGSKNGLAFAQKRVLVKRLRQIETGSLCNIF